MPKIIMSANNNSNDNCIFLRPLQREDAQVSWRWRNDSEVWKLTFRQPDQVVTPALEEEWIDKVLADKNRLNFAICLNETKQYIGNVYLTDIDWMEKSGFQGTFIGEKSFWGKGIGTQARMLMHQIVAEEYGIKMIYSEILEDNLASIKSALKCGFTEIKRSEGRITFVKELC